jgi:hypothetical protein
MHMQAIVTKFLGPSNTRGSRIKARAAAGSITIPYNHSLNSQANHVAAASALAEKLGWNGFWISGGLPSEDGDVFVLAATRFDYTTREFTDLEFAFVVLGA